MERPHESIELTPHTVTARSENEDLPSPLKDKSSNLKKERFVFFFKRNFMYMFLLDTSNDNIPLESNTARQYKINLRSESEITPTIQTITTDTQIRSSTDTQSVKPFESGMLIFTICIYSRYLLSCIMMLFI
jgi:hypothetical protein